MVVPLIIGVALIGVSTLFVADALGTLLHWSAVFGSLVGASALFWNLDKENYLEIESPSLAVIAYAAVSGLAGLVLFRLSEALISAASGIVALVSILVVVGLFVRPDLVVRFLAGLINIIIGVLDGEY